MKTSKMIKALQQAGCTVEFHAGGSVHVSRDSDEDGHPYLILNASNKQALRKACEHFGVRIATAYLCTCGEGNK